MMSSPGSITMDDIPDIQGLILRGYNFHFITYAVFKIQDVAGARAFCASLLPKNKGVLSVTNAEPWTNGKPNYCLNIGFTYDGMLQLIGQTNCDAINQVSTSEVFGIYQNGAIADAATVGDTANSDPSLWWKRAGGWLLPTDPDPNGNDLHIQITIYTHSPELRHEYYETLLGMIPKNDKGVAAIIPAFVKKSDPVVVNGNKDHIHFGYRDSLSQPYIINPLWKQDPTDDRPPVDTYRFVIRHDSPAYNAHQFLQNGTFAAFRLLYQDVKAFNNYIHSDPNAAPGLLAAKMCGRWLDGTPLEVSPTKEDKTLSGFDYTNFNYHTPSDHQKGVRQNDDAGLLCPYAAHIRRTNPRDDQAVTGNADPTSFAVQHRVLRRATPYGPEYSEGEVGEVQRGLVGLFMGANLTEQFEFLMQFWMMTGGFREGDDSPDASGVDPLFGPQTDDWNLQADSIFHYNVQTAGPPSGTAYTNIPGLSRFIRTDGSLYLFLPGLTGLEWLSKGSIPPNTAVTAY